MNQEIYGLLEKQKKTDGASQKGTVGRQANDVKLHCFISVDDVWVQIRALMVVGPAHFDVTIAGLKTRELRDIQAQLHSPGQIGNKIEMVAGIKFVIDDMRKQENLRKWSERIKLPKGSWGLGIRSSK